MTPQFANQVVSSAILYLDHTILKKGSAFSNHNSYFYSTNNLYNGYYSYSAPLGQFVADSSIAGATIMTGVYLDNTLLTTGVSGFFNVNYDKALVYFSSNITGNNRLSGSYALKDFDIVLTNESEVELLLEDTYSFNPKTFATSTGLAPNQISYPVIFVKPNGGTNKPFAFGGEDLTTYEMRLIVIADSQFNLDAVCGILQDTAFDTIPLISSGEMPFNIFGGMKSPPYHYDQLVTGKVSNGSGIYIKDVFVNRLNQKVRTDVNRLHPGTYIAFVDYILEKNRFPRQ